MKTNKKLKNTVITLSSILSLSLLGGGFLASLNQTSLNSNLPFNAETEIYSEEIDYSTKIQTQAGSSLYIDSEGNLYTFGNNEYGQLGVGEKIDEEGDLINFNTPQQIVVGNNEKVVQAGFTNSYTSSLISTYAITESGDLYMWGGNFNNNLGVDPYSGAVLSPQKINFPNGEKVTKVEHSDGLKNAYYTIALTESGNVYVWGDNSEGQLGLGYTSSANDPVTTPTLVEIEEIKNEKIVDISNNGQLQAVTESGDLYMWGDNIAGQVGSGDNQNSVIVTPTKIKIGENEKVKNAHTNTYLSYVITKTDKLYAWGLNSQYSLGNESQENSYEPILIDLVPGSEEDTVAEAWVSVYDSYAITTDGTLYKWGINNDGQVGNGTSGTGEEVTKPLEIDVVPGEVDNIKPIQSNYETDTSSFAITEDGNIYTWGSNNNGQLGLSKDDNPIDEPELVNLNDEKAIYADIAGNSFILTDQGNLYFFGSNTYGELGNGDENNDNQNTPVLIAKNIFYKIDNDNSLSAGAIAGIVIGSIAGAALIGAGSWYFIKKRKEA